MSPNLSPGARLGHYEIRSKIGAGGMGEVYLAQDTKLDRKVALKILPADVAVHQDRMKRFVQEAKSASALNHPNIATSTRLAERWREHHRDEFVTVHLREIHDEQVREVIPTRPGWKGCRNNIAISTPTTS